MKVQTPSPYFLVSDHKANVYSHNNNTNVHYFGTR